MLGSVAIYVFVCAWPLFLSALINSQKNRNLYITLAFIPYIVFSALRGFRVGTDTVQFASLFQTIIKADWNQFGIFRYEPLFLVFCKLLGYLSKDPHVLIIFSSLLMGICAIYATQRLSLSPVLSSCLYGTTLVFFIDLNIMRQGLATAIITAGLPALFNGCRKQFIIFATLGFLFHHTSIFFSCLCLFAYRKIDSESAYLVEKYYCYKKKVVRILFFVLPAVVILLPQIFYYIGDDTLYSIYAKNLSYLKFAAHFLIMVPLLFFLINQTNKRIDSVQQFCWTIFCTELVLLFLANLNGVASRLAFYFHSLLFLLIPMVGKHLKSQERKQIHIEIMFFFSLYAALMIKVLLHEWGFFPYEFMWNESVVLELSWIDSLI